MAVETITSVSIRGFRSIRAVDNLELRPLNVMIGANGAGKSNFIDFFRMLNFALAATSGSLQQYVRRYGGADSLVYYGQKVTRHIDASIHFSGDKRWSQYDFSLTWGAPDNLFYASEEIQYKRDADQSPRKRQLGSGHQESRLLELASDPTASPYRTEARVFRDRLRQIRAYHFHDTSEGASIRITQDLEKEHYLQNNGGNLAAFLHRLREDRGAHYKRILSTVQLVAPFIGDFDVDPDPLNPRSTMLRWIDRSGRTFGPHQLSDGTLRAIALITALLQPEETLPSIMLFDEPELGLHPNAVGVVAGLIRAASLKRQVIVGTQSPRLLTDLCPEDVLVLERREDSQHLGETTIDRLSASALGSWLEDYDLGALYEMNVTGGAPQ